MLIQFEDFANHYAFRLLHKYRDAVCVFNDDIQGTAAVALAGLFSALRVTGGKLARPDASCSSAPARPRPASPISCVSAMMAEGLSEAEALRRSWLVDSRGLVVSGRDGPRRPQAAATRTSTRRSPTSSTAIRTLKPTAIIGVAAVGGAFTPEVLEAMAELNERPIVFALSNPTSKAECTAEEAYRYTGGRALFACGSPFDPVQARTARTFVPRQGNNSYIFPGVGLGAIASGVAAASPTRCSWRRRTRSPTASRPTDLEQGSLYPALPRIREVSAHIAAAVADVAYQRGLATGPRRTT